MTREFAADADDDEVERLRALLTEGIHTERACQKRALLAEAALAEEKAHADRTNAYSLQVNKENERLRAALATAREALEFFADHDNWRRGRKLDPNSANFIGRIHALAALAALAAMEPPDA